MSIRTPSRTGAFGICVALAPESAECIYQRALAHGALGHTERAIRDYDLALARNPKFAAAFLNRGILYLQEKRHGLALEDLRHALACGADPATIYYNESLVHLARHDRPAALASLEQALSLTPCPRGARVLFERLRREP